MSPEWRHLPERVRELIKQFHDVAPVRLPDLARALGVPVKAATLAPGISGEVRPDGNGGFIARINRHDPKKRQRFSVAHELAHVLLHADQIGEGITDDVLYRSTLSNRVEAEANRLAADILMPDDLVLEYLEIAEERGGAGLIIYLAEAFSVSEAAMKIKLDQLGVAVDA
ncbi:hypothetical protein FHW96_002847 [Novosphingobium sp. SG751A]|uniref:ImmA/IrrE family metallo-endopeptidase n=1 Tax=Novosphingobium sp. SG751A TaxID=2587000 RepID=UPI0015569BAD|nr:ImmA/IrrE family metallo-endopeptidase [Novosphingobium sp. SG751A]NOW46687.1 hypothetical protein [Novosphingobium sp. SG751A]